MQTVVNYSIMRLRQRKRLALILLAGGFIITYIFITTTPESKEIGQQTKEYVRNNNSDLKFREEYPVIWPEWERHEHIHNGMPSTVHYLWCGVKQFTFKNYLSVLSAVHAIKPLVFNIHYTHLPEKDSSLYNTWFEQFNQKESSLSLHHITDQVECCSENMLKMILDFLSIDGGIFVGETVILTRRLSPPKESDFWFYSSASEKDLTNLVIVAKTGFDKKTEEEYFKRITSSHNQPCVSVDQYNTFQENSTCIEMKDDLNPRDIWESNSSFAELSRLLYYGRRQIMKVRRADRPTIPRIIHFVWLLPDNKTPRPFNFPHYLSVLSALHVAGFYHAYVHGDVQPNGTWWQRLSEHNVTFVHITRPRTVYQQEIGPPGQASDIIRLEVLYKYGGAYQDWDVIWSSRVPDSLLTYPAVVSLDWPSYGNFPETFNLGVELASPGAPWLRHLRSAFLQAQKGNWLINAVMLPYRIYEQHPESVYLDRHLMVICYLDICHPTWHPDYKRNLNDRRPTPSFDWRVDVRAFHVTQPKPAHSFASTERLKDGKDIFAQIGRHVLEQSGQMRLLSD